MEQEADTIDPVVEYVLLGDSITDGIFAVGLPNFHETMSTLRLTCRCSHL